MFQDFCKESGIDTANRKYHRRNPSFIVPTFTKLEERFGTTRINWWWQNGPFFFWFEHLRDGRLKLVLELGPLHGDARLTLIEELEVYGVDFKPVSKLKSAKYTRLYTNAKVIDD